MMAVLVQVIVWLNALASAVSRVALAPIGVLPGWVSATILSAVTGVLLLIAYKYTSNQQAIKRVRNDINANLLALRLFKDSPTVALRAQGRLTAGAQRLFVLSLVPMAAMLVPVCLLLAQLALWYQFRPLRVGEDAVLTLALKKDAGSPDSPLPAVSLEPTDAAQVAVGPVRVRSKREVCWNIRARRPGLHHLVFDVDGQTVEKELAVGDGFMRVSVERPPWRFEDVLLHPAERPFRPDSLVQSIGVVYPDRASWTSGTDYWVIYWFGMSMVAAFCFRGLFHVNI